MIGFSTTTTRTHTESFFSRTVQGSLRVLGARYGSNSRMYKSKVAREVARRSITNLARRSLTGGPASAIESSANASGKNAAPFGNMAAARSKPELTRAVTEPSPVTRPITAMEMRGQIEFYAEALFEYTPDPADASLLPLRRGDIVHVVKTDDAKGWWAGYVKQSMAPEPIADSPDSTLSSASPAPPAIRVGWIPRSFMRPLKPVMRA
ncbi:hypothetical protein BKA62DRAFT_212410 [Auriculariales sp. MPI-PUGE-AT-0066]|nr:hypothetical protein BKA62DRAFT_174378 [Auriculariales sp. MPI-PUGE-AT-0066]KAH7106688.1 hypothetical protein BKA62DRAFT_212410 [Auriculariales sp. MPI-PUGE-AT-0066]